MTHTENKGNTNMDEIKDHTAPLMCSTRLGFVVTTFFVFVTVAAIQVSVSLVIVCMVNHTEVMSISRRNNYTSETRNLSPNCTTTLSFGPKNSVRDGEYVWMKDTQGLVLSSFYWGYLITQIPGGIIATKFGGKVLVGASMITIGISTLLCPLATRYSPYFLMALRVIAGLGAGVTFPASIVIFAAWTPPMESTKLTAGAFSGMQIAAVVVLAVSGTLCQYVGWNSIFYILGSCCLGCSIVWFIVVYDKPEEHPRISPSERKYITESHKGHNLPQKAQGLQIPWGAIFKSGPFWGIAVCHFSVAWCYITFQTLTPSYLNDVLHLDIKSNGLILSCMYLSMWLVTILCGILSDYLRSRKVLSTTVVRKVMCSIGLLLPSGLIIGVGFLDCDQAVIALVLLACEATTTGFVMTVIYNNHVDIAPRYAGITSGITNTLASVAGIIGPAVSGLIVKQQTREEWQLFFYISSGIVCFGWFVYMIVGSGELQAWGLAPLDNQNEFTLKNMEDDTTEKGIENYAYSRRHSYATPL